MDRALDRLSRRGPDGVHRWQSGDAQLGHARLAINDPSPAGRQPMTLGDVTMVCNGEIYNAPALRSALEDEGAAFGSTCDVEVLLHGYVRWGLRRTLEAVHGMYAVVFWNERTRVLEAAVDHAGMKPLVYAAGRGSIVLASDADSVCDAMRMRPTIDRMSVCHMLCHGYIPPPRTIWQGVGKLGPARTLRWSAEDGVRLSTHWAPGACELDDEAFGPLWEDVVAEHLLSDVPLGLFLSGGLDSSSIAAALASIGRTDVRAFTLDLEGPDSEADEGAAIAAHCGLEHESIRFEASEARDTLMHAARAYDEPQAYGALLTAMRLARAASAHGKVMLAGDGGDEAFGGYTWHRPAPPLPDAHDHASLAAMVSRRDADEPTRWKALEALAGLSPLHQHLQRVFPRFHPAEAAALTGAAYDEQAYVAWAHEHVDGELPWPRWAQCLDLRTFCAGSILPKVDRASMHVGLEVRAPMLDRRIIEFGLSRQVRDDEDESSRPVVREYVRGRVPARVLTRPKQGFSLRLDGDPWTPMMGWLDRSRVVQDEVIRRDWRAYAGPGTPYGRGRLQALLFLAAWYEERA